MYLLNEKVTGIYPQEREEERKKERRKEQREREERGEGGREGAREERMVYFFHISQSEGWGEGPLDSTCESEIRKH